MIGSCTFRIVPYRVCDLPNSCLRMHLVCNIDFQLTIKTPSCCCILIGTKIVSLHGKIGNRFVLAPLYHLTIWFDVFSSDSRCWYIFVADLQHCADPQDVSFFHLFLPLHDNLANLLSSCPPFSSAWAKMSAHEIDPATLEGGLDADRGNNVINCVIVFVVLCTIFLVLRFTSHRISSRPICLEDWVMIPAWFLMMGLCVNVICSEYIHLFFCKSSLIRTS